jgi:SAM-dependent methyltransferase
MDTPPLTVGSRELRERRAWDEDRVWENCEAWMRRVAHVTDGPNTRRGEELYRQLLASATPNARVLEVGCGPGKMAMSLLPQGPQHVLGIDISRAMIEIALTDAAPKDERLEFRLHNANAPLDGTFDLIFGRAVLHHIDYREFLLRAYRSNLATGGRMMFMEPMAHPLALAFHRLVRSAHTPDEHPLGPAFVSWLQRTFPAVELEGINLISFPAGAISSFVFARADNGLMRAADALDMQLLSRAPWLSTYARQGVIVISKP